jgi:hypothetical protein
MQRALKGARIHVRAGRLDSELSFLCVPHSAEADFFAAKSHPLANQPPGFRAYYERFDNPEKHVLYLV